MARTFCSLLVLWSLAVAVFASTITRRQTGPKNLPPPTCPYGITTPTGPVDVNLEGTYALNYVLRLGTGFTRDTKNVFMTFDARMATINGVVRVHLLEKSDIYNNALIITKWDNIPTGRGVPNEEVRVPVERGKETIACAKLGDVMKGHWYAQLEN